MLCPCRVERLDIDLDVSFGAKRSGFFMSTLLISPCIPFAMYLGLLYMYYRDLFFSDYLLVNHRGYCLLMKFEMPERLIQNKITFLRMLRCWGRKSGKNIFVDGENGQSAKNTRRDRITLRTLALKLIILSPP
jgi:hypothetical protein